MSEGGSGFLVDEFLEALTTQLDRTQDALAIKAVNRPLTYAIKEFALELKVFVNMDQDGKVRFRPSGPNDEGASNVRIDFTTITRPMIEENTVSLDISSSPSLREIGLKKEERKRFERMGVFNAAQLERLNITTGDRAVERLSGVSKDSIKKALKLSSPTIHAIEQVEDKKEPEQTKPEIPEEDTPSQPGHLKPEMQKRPPWHRIPKTHGPRGKKPKPVITKVPLGPDGKGSVKLKPEKEGAVVGKKPGHSKTPPPGKKTISPKNMIKIKPDAHRLRIVGRNLIGVGRVPDIRMNNKTLPLLYADEDQLEVELPLDTNSGVLEIQLGGEVLLYNVIGTDEKPAIDNIQGIIQDDPWAPKV